MITYLSKAKETIETIAHSFFGDLLHADSLAKINSVDKKKNSRLGLK